MQQPKPREIREAARVSQLQVAARAGKSLPTVRLYEADPESVSEHSRRALAPVYAAIAGSFNPPPTQAA